MASNSNNHESPSASVFAGIVDQSFSSSDLRRGNSSGSISSLGSALSSTYTTTNVLCPVAATAVAKAGDEMGLLNPATTTVKKLNSVDKELVEDLILVENTDSMRRFPGINNTCDLSRQRHGIDLSRNISDAADLKSTIEEQGQALEVLEVQSEHLRDTYRQHLRELSHQTFVREADSDLYNARMKDASILATKYAFTEWIQANPEALAMASVPEAQLFVGLQSQEQVRFLTQKGAVQKLRLLKRLGWDKSAYILKVFGGAMIIKPRHGTMQIMQDLLIAYLRLAPDEEMVVASRVLHKDQIQPTITAVATSLAAICEDEEGDDHATTAKKRQARDLFEDLLNPDKKRRFE
jgi:hypothetical protein